MMVMMRWRVDGVHRYSQLSSCRVHTCLSMGYFVRSMLQAIVAVILLCVHSEIVRKLQKLLKHSYSFDVDRTINN